MQAHSRIRWCDPKISCGSFTRFIRQIDPFKNLCIVRAQPRHKLSKTAANAFLVRKIYLAIAQYHLVLHVAVFSAPPCSLTAVMIGQH